jgi:uncharacterized protein (TIGR03086 family)
MTATDDPTTTSSASLYERIGGRPALERIVPDVIALHLANPVVGHRFRAASTPVPELTRLAIEFFATGLSGEPTYDGRSMVETHAGMAITDAEFVAVLDDILLALDRHGIGPTERAELLAIAYGMKGDIVEAGAVSPGRPRRQLVFEPDRSPSGAEQLSQVVPILGSVVAAVRPEDMDRPTGCDGWTVRDLLNHLVGGAEMFAAAFAGAPLQDISGQLPDHVGDDPAGAFARAAEGFGAAVQREGALQVVFDLPFGTMTGATFLRFAAFDLLVHAWDLATAIGAPLDEPPDALVAEVDRFAHEVLAGGRDPVGFAPARPVPEGASPMSALVAYSGRRSVTGSPAGRS